MTLAGLHFNWRGSGGTYDDIIDTINNVPGAQWAGDKYLNWALANPGAERVVNAYVALDVVSNSGDATVMGGHALLEDADASFVYELTDPIGNPFDMVGGAIESGGEAIDYEGVRLIGSGTEGIGEFISDPVESLGGSEGQDEWYDSLFGGSEGEAADAGAGNETDGTDNGYDQTTDEPTTTEEPTDSTGTTEEPTDAPTTEEPTSTPEEIGYSGLENNLDAEDRQAVWEYLNDASATQEVNPDSVYLDDPSGGIDINVEGYNGDRELDMLDSSESEYLQNNLDRIVELWQEDPDRFQ